MGRTKKWQQYEKENIYLSTQGCLMMTMIQLFSCFYVADLDEDGDGHNDDDDDDDNDSRR